MILCAKYILPLDKDVIYNGAIVIKNKTIEAIGTKDEVLALYPKEKIKDLKNTILFPSFVNLHTHLEYSSFKTSKPISFIKWLPKLIAKSKTYNPKDWKKSTRLGIEKLKKTGIATIVDIHRLGTSPEDLKSQKYNSFIFFELIAPDEQRIDEVLSLLEVKINKLSKKGLFAGISPHSLYSLSLESIKKISLFAKKHNLPIMIHVSETKEEMQAIINNRGALKEIMQALGVKIKYGHKKTPVQLLAENNILGPNTIIVHGVYLTKKDISLLKEFNSSVALCPKSNEFLKTGKAPIKELLKAGVNLGIGTDSLASNNLFDMFSEMKLVKKIYPKIDYKDLLILATLNGAKILSINFSSGTLSPGKYADIIGVKIKNKSIIADPYKYVCENGSLKDICLSVFKGKVM